MKSLRLNTDKYAVCLLFLFFSSFLKAQETIVTYIKKDGGHTIYKDSADYTSIIRLTPNEEGLYELNEYYADETLKRHGWIKTADPLRLRFEGLVESYYDTGALETVVRYAENQRVDTAEKYYRNGILKEREAYLKRSEEQLGFPRPDTSKRLVYYADSLGNVQVQDGNGKAEIIYNKIDVERGEYAGGLRTGRWEGTFHKGKYHFEEWYQNGVVSKGLTTDSIGKQHAYEHREIQPEYPGGKRSFAGFVAQNYHYPKEAVQAKVTGQLRIRFVVDTTGVPIEFKVIHDLGYGTAAAGIDAIKKAERWAPGYQRGVPVRVAYTIPLTLNRSKRPSEKSSSK